MCLNFKKHSCELCVPPLPLGMLWDTHEVEFTYSKACEDEPCLVNKASIDALNLLFYATKNITP